MSKTSGRIECPPLVGKWCRVPAVSVPIRVERIYVNTSDGQDLWLVGRDWYGREIERRVSLDDVKEFTRPDDTRELWDRDYCCEWMIPDDLVLRGDALLGEDPPDWEATRREHVTWRAVGLEVDDTFEDWLNNHGYVFFDGKHYKSL